MADDCDLRRYPASSSKDRKVKVGALWTKEGARGTYHTGKLEVADVRAALDSGKTKLLVFVNGFKDAENKTDLIVSLADPKASK